MKTIKIRTVGVEFPANTTRVSLDIVETNGIITRTTESLVLNVPGIYQNMNTELFNIILTELNSAGYSVMNPNTAE
jgi:site-specific DNA-cytosine methylase